MFAKKAQFNSTSGKTHGYWQNSQFNECLDELSFLLIRWEWKKFSQEPLVTSNSPIVLAEVSLKGMLLLSNKVTWQTIFNFPVLHCLRGLCTLFRLPLSPPPRHHHRSSIPSLPGGYSRRRYDSVDHLGFSQYYDHVQLRPVFPLRVEVSSILFKSFTITLLGFRP